jgi:hypothetical protein
VTRWAQSGSRFGLMGPLGGPLALIEVVPPTGQYSKICPQVEAHVLSLSAPHAKVRRDRHRVAEGLYGGLDPHAAE